MTDRKWCAMFVAMLLVGTVALAQAPAGPPKPGPEHKRQSVFVGKWTGSGDMKPGPWGPGGKMTWTETCEWFPGGFSVVCHSDMKGAMGDGKGLSLMGYSTEEKKYFYFSTEGISGSGELSKGSVQGKVWTWTGESIMGGKPVKSKFTITEQSNDAMAFKGESSVAGGPWAVTFEGKNTRAK